MNRFTIFLEKYQNKNMNFDKFNEVENKLCVRKALKDNLGDKYTEYLLM